jgi:hypothetical protein
MLKETYSQEAVTVSGGSGTGSGGSIEYTVGQIVYKTYVDTKGSVAEGMQQPFEISVVTSVEEGNTSNIQCKSFPNPTSDFINIVIDNQLTDGLNYQLFDMNGKLLESNVISSNETKIEMKSYVSSTYFIKINNVNNKEIKNFKVIKK